MHTDTGDTGDGVAVVVVTGAIDAQSAYDLYLAAVAAAEAGATEVVLDLSGVTFVDSVGLGMLVRARDELPRLERPVRFALRAPSERVASLLRITALADEFRYA